MGSIFDSQQQKQHRYRFPLSPPSSGTVTAISSPRLGHLTPNEPEIADKLIASTSAFRRSNSQTTLSWKKQSDDNATDSDGYITERISPRHPVRRRSTRKQESRPLTLPTSGSTFPPSMLTSPPRKARPLSRRSSESSTGSSSSHEHAPLPQSSAGMGRKVAATLQLFKEMATTPSEEIKQLPPVYSRPGSSAGNRRTSSSSKADGVAEAQFEFVKRSEWPEREAAATRRERSSTTLERVRTRESIVNMEESERGKERGTSIRDSSDLVQWRKDVLAKQDSSRGRRRERISDDLYFDLDVGSDVATSTSYLESSLPPFERPRSRAYPPSPSPSRSPASRLRSRSHTEIPEIASTSRPRSRSSIPIQTRSSSGLEYEIISRPLSPLDSTAFSSLSTDDESWETASVSTSTSTTSAISSFSPLNNYSLPPRSSHLPDNDDNCSLLPSNGGVESSRIGIDQSEDSEGYLDLDFDLPKDHLPHIPLRPFRNQVGGHSAIYKFTKRAVCKPLVSRENLFYESVEREAPPLLGFIPRYLGVMLVSYRRVPKGANGLSHPEPPSKPSTALSHPIRPSFRKASTDAPKASQSIQISNGQMPKILCGTTEGGDTESDEAEMPEVLLDNNRHIIPEWMLRHRSLSHSHASSTSPIPRHLKRKNLTRGTASSPDLGSSPDRLDSTARPSPSPLAQYPPFVSSEMDAPTPTNSPSQSLWAFPARLAETSKSGDLLKSVSEDDDAFARRKMRAFSEQTRCPYPMPGMFGGTGSTVVNRKLKDHVFSTVLRRFRRRTGGRWATGERTEDEGDVADEEGDDVASGHGADLVRRNKKLISHADRLRHAQSERYAAGIRRVQSESTMASPGKMEALEQEQERSKDMMDVFQMDYDHVPDLGTRNRPWLDIGLTPSITRRRSRSRSLDLSKAPVRLAATQLHPERASIPEQNEIDPSVTRQNHFILMEDLTGRLKHPCVMDLKMGTRQYGIDATTVKKKSQRKKCDRTTSRSLGVRVCGMQVWNHVTQSYNTQDKYMGREVRPEEFNSVLASFLYDGDRLLAYQIPILLQKIYALARIINRLKGYRFYGCSLLLIYDGDKETQEAFKLSVLEHPSSRTKRGESLERHASRSKSEHEPERTTLRRSHSEDLLIGPVAKRSSGRRKRGEVNVRIVDFAHTTTGRDWLPYPPATDRCAVQEVNTCSKGYHAEVDPETGLLYARFPPHYPDQPDRGFLFGLKNLATTLEQIWNGERIRRIKASRDDPSIAAFQLPPLPTDGKDIFDEIFGSADEDDPGMVST